MFATGDAVQSQEAVRRTTVDQRILRVLSLREPLDMHDLTLSLWPDLEQKPREVALSAVFYLRSRVDVLVSQGLVRFLDGKLTIRAS